MMYLIATILSSTSIFVVFRLAKNYSINLTNLITVNYFVASLLGFGYFMHFNFRLLTDIKPWFPFAVLLGTLFIIMFFLIGTSSQKAGITVTTLANKLSLVFPVLFSIVYFHETISVVKYFGLGLAVTAIFLTVYKKELNKTNRLYILLPVTLFLGSGFTDSVLKFVQGEKIAESDSATFSFWVFFSAFILAAVISLIKIKSGRNNTAYSPTLILGSILGMVNFGSLFFLINALNKSNLNSSFVFALVNISIVMLSAIAGKTIFNEKLNILNVLGIFLATVSIYFLLK